MNIFNRTLLPNPSTSNPQNAPGTSSGIYSNGFGVINTYLPQGSVYGTGGPYLLGRTGTLIARFSF